MIITYFRSSSLNKLDFCEHSFFLEYVLGLETDGNLAAELGTVSHKIFEILAIITKKLNSGEKSIPFTHNDELLGDIEITKDWYNQYELSPIEIEHINQYRKSDKKYLSKFFIGENHSRKGKNIVDSIFNKAFDYYSQKSIHNYTNEDRERTYDWVWCGLDYKNGMYDPRNKNIVDTELHFDFVIEEDWAKYSYDIRGKKVEGNLAIRGTIDLITSPNENILEIIDYKTGQRKNWNTGETKTYKKLCEDEQLMLYYKVAKKLYPQYRTIIPTIFYIRDGGPISLPYEDNMESKIDDILKKKFLRVKNCKIPELLDPERNNFKCKNFCHFGKNNYKNTGKSICQFFAEQVQEYGIFDVTDKFMIGDAYNTYNAPGE